MMHTGRDLVAAGTDLTLSVGLGQLEYQVSFEGRVTAYRYDNSAAAGGRLVQKFFYDTELAYTTDRDDNGTLDSPAQTVSYTYDAFGRQIEIDDSLNGITTNSFDAQGRLTQISSPQGVVNHAYDDLGRLFRTYTRPTIITDFSTYTPTTGDDIALTDTEYVYDALGRLSQVIAQERFDTVISGGETTTYAYDLIGNLDFTDLPNGVTTDYIYDAHNRLDVLTHFIDTDGDKTFDFGAETLLSSFDYTVNLAGNRTNVTEVDDAGNTVNITWTYDALNRLIAETRDLVGASFEGNFNDAYTFDLVGNRLTKTHYDNVAGTGTSETRTYTYDDNDRLLKDVTDDAQAPG